MDSSVNRKWFGILFLGLVAVSSGGAYAQGTKLPPGYDFRPSAAVVSSPFALGPGESRSLPGEDRDDPKRREEWFRHGRTVAGMSSAMLRKRAYIQKMQLRAEVAAGRKSSTLGPVTPTNTGEWTPVGPAPLASDSSGFGSQDYSWVSGRATSVAIDPADPTGNTVYIGGAYAGVWKSTNAGPASNPDAVVWTPLTDTQATLAVGSIAIQPQPTAPDPAKSVILIGTGETNSSVDSYFGSGILRSQDAGSTWALVETAASGQTFDGLGFSKIAFSSQNPAWVVAAAASTPEGIIENQGDASGQNRGIYYSHDSAVTWTYASVTDGGVTILPSSVTSVAYNAGVGSAGTFFAAVRHHGIYSSVDGIRWARLNTQPRPINSVSLCPPLTSAGCPIYRAEFAVVPNRAEMYVWFVDANDGDQGIWQTVDGGSSWSPIDDSQITSCGDLFGCGTTQGIYDLELAAAPNGVSATDLYAGAINLYKCSINSINSNCSGTGSNNFLNLTHVYGCSPDFGSIAHVHPDQHALDFAIVNSRAIMYFANDGGIYRALDGFTGLNSGNCSVPNQFDSLNQTLGSMTQFVSFSQSSSDANTILGGTQDNGSPATASAGGTTQWTNVNGGDGGYNEINPADSSDWFTANTNVSIQRCTLGINCHAADFLEVVSSATVGGDQGAFYTPYILDAQNPGELVVGTCRVWRGGSSGAGFSVLTNNLDTGSNVGCTGAEVNMVRSLASGGPTDSNGFSNVIYAGTDGYGPNVATTQTGGHLWLTTNAAGGVNTWSDRTGPINPLNFPISGVAIDSSDGTGLTAYVTIMGFVNSHVWKTSSGGTSWSDFSSNLPDSPANAILVDPDAGIVYVGTDMGVFSSSTSSPFWTETGPAPSSGRPGFLPNVPVTALRLYHSGFIKKLRASTYGRGIWELVTSRTFAIAVADNSLTVFPGQSAVYPGTITAFNGYNTRVDLSCTGGVPFAPAACAVVPVSITPSATPTPVVLTITNAPVGDYSFNLDGNDGRLGDDAALTLHVVDFAITTPAPDTITVVPGGAGGTTFVVNALGAFSSAVALSCASPLPVGVTCSFQPAVVTPIAANPASVILTISTTSNTPVAVSTITINASSEGVNRSQTVSLAVIGGSAPNYALSISNPSLTAATNTTATFNGTLTSINGYSSAVNLTCAGYSPPTCGVSPTSVTPTLGGAPFTVTVSSSVAQAYNFSISGTGTDLLAIQQAVPVTFTTSPSTFTFTLTSTPTSQTVTGGQPATYSLDVLPGFGNFPNAVTFSCSGLPAGYSCSAPVVSAGSSDSEVTLTVNTVASRAAWIKTNFLSGLYGLTLIVPGLILFAANVGLPIRLASAWQFWPCWSRSRACTSDVGADCKAGAQRPGGTPCIPIQWESRRLADLSLHRRTLR
ncbi:MAG: hypothetical protein JOY93_00630 [Acidobacteriales bacterium]|nr:hypothetical protein [Terriglobales bacterium]